MKLLNNLLLAVSVVVLTSNSVFAQRDRDDGPSYGPGVDVGGKTIRPFYESTPTGRTNDVGKPATNRFGWPESSSAVGISIPLGGKSRAAALLPEEYEDSAFDSYVELLLLGEAVNTNDASLATDVALQLAHAEQVLARSHRAMSAEDAMLVAARMAANRKDALKRIKKAAKRYGYGEVESQIRAAEDLTGQTRDPSTEFTVDLSKISAEQLVIMSDVLAEIERAAAIGDADVLQQLNEAINQSEPLLQEQQKALMDRIASVERQIEGADEKTTHTLQQLSDASRESVSKIFVVSSPFIDDKGNIWSGSGSGGGRGRWVGKADREWDSSGRAYWVSNYNNIYGGIERKRVPRHDRIHIDEKVEVKRKPINWDRDRRR